MSRIQEAIEKLEKITDRHICFSRREELQEVIDLLRAEQKQMNDMQRQSATADMKDVRAASLKDNDSERPV